MRPPTLNFLLKSLLIFVVTLLVAARGATAQPDVAGHWEGTIEVPGTGLQVMVDLARDGDSWSGTIDIPMQGAKGLGLKGISVDGDQVKFTIDGVPGDPTFHGTYADQKISGEFHQGPAKIPFELGRDAVEAPKRPQDPEKPYPYDAIDVSYAGGDDGVQLAATITLPKGDGPFPGAVLITGSGGQNRDEELLGHRPFLVLADHLTRAGFAVLRADDRGIAESTGDIATSTSENFARDALASLRYLAKQDRVQADAVGFIGHSEGGLVGPLAASMAHDEVAFIVSMAGPGVPGDEILRLQMRLIVEANGSSAEEIEKLSALQAEAIALMKQDATDETRAGLRAVIEKQLKASPETLSLEGEDLENAIQASLAQSLNPWFQFFLTHDPRPTLEKLTMPFLVINGELDLQVDADQNVGEIAAALERAGNDDVTVQRFEGLNHLFQTSTTGSPAEYATIEETFAPVALEAISSWLKERFAR